MTFYKKKNSGNVSGMQCAFGWRARNNTAQEDLYLLEIQLSGHESVGEYELETAKNSGRKQRWRTKRGKFHP